MSALPQSFSYFANKLAGVSRKQLKLTPNNSTTIKQNENATFVLPTDSICDLTSMQMVYNFKYQNAPAVPNNARCRYCPAPHQLVRSAQWTINNQVVSGAQNQHFAQVYEALRVASQPNENVNSRIDEYSAPPVANLIGNSTNGLYGTANERVASNSVGRRCKMTEFLGLQSSPNSMNHDTSVLGETRLELQFNGNEVALITGDEACVSADADWQIEDVHMLIDVISFASPEYDMLLSAMLQEGSLLIPYNEITSQKSLLNSNIRFNVASSSLDMVGFALLKDTHTTFTNFTTGTATGTLGQQVQKVANELSPNQVSLTYRNASDALASNLTAHPNQSDSVSASYFFTINGQIYPQQGSTPLKDAPEATKAVYGGHGKDEFNQLFLGHSTQADVNKVAGAVDSCPSAVNLEYAKNYRRVNYLDRNCFVAIRTCLDTPASQNANRAMSGINTLGQSSQISLSLSSGFNFNKDSALLIGQGSSVIQVGAGQQIAVIN